MGKKEKSFSKMLKENKNKIRITKGDCEMSLADAVEESVEKIVTTQIDSLIPVTATEAAESSLDAKTLGLTVSYVQPVFSLYESAIKYGNVKQTMLVALEADEADRIFNNALEDFALLKSRTNLSLILDSMSDKSKKRILKFSESDENDNDIFVIKIPDVVMFYDTITKKEVTKCKYIDLIVMLVKTKKSLYKIKKKNKEFFNELSDSLVNSTVKIITDLGVSCLHLKLDTMLFDDPHDYASMWVKYLDADATKKILSRIIFCTDNPDILAQFNSQIRAELSANVGMESI